MQSINYTNLFSGDYDNKIDDVYFELICRLDRQTLESYRITNKLLNNFCDSDYWLGRINQSGLTALLPLRRFYSSLASFYKFIRQDSCYVITCDGRMCRAYTDIKLAYNSVLKSMENCYFYKEYEIVVMINGVKSRELEQYVIWSDLKDEENFHNTNILLFPTLTSRDIILIKYYIEDVSEGKHPHIARMIKISTLDNDFSNLSRSTNKFIRLMPVDCDSDYLALDLLSIKDDTPIFYNAESRYKIFVLNISENPNRLDYKIVIINNITIKWITEAIINVPTVDLTGTLRSVGSIFFDLSELRTVIDKYN